MQCVLPVKLSECRTIANPRKDLAVTDGIAALVGQVLDCQQQPGGIDRGALVRQRLPWRDPTGGLEVPAVAGAERHCKQVKALGPERGVDNRAADVALCRGRPALTLCGRRARMRRLWVLRGAATKRSTDTTMCTIMNVVSGLCA